MNRTSLTYPPNGLCFIGTGVIKMKVGKVGESIVRRGTVAIAGHFFFFICP
jgi:hypothetical protein